jgi:hypothetical protein
MRLFKCGPTVLTFVLVMLALARVGQCDCPNGASITSPTGGTFSSTANIGVSGDATLGSSFTVQIINLGNNTVYGSEGVTAGSNGSWSTTVDAPSNGWPKNTTLTIQAICGGNVYAGVEIRIGS